MTTLHAAHVLKLAFRCMQMAEKTPSGFRAGGVARVIEECRKSRRERKRIIDDIQAHFWYPVICKLNGVKL